MFKLSSLKFSKPESLQFVIFDVAYAKPPVRIETLVGLGDEGSAVEEHTIIITLFFLWRS